MAVSAWAAFFFFFAVASVTEKVAISRAQNKKMTILFMEGTEKPFKLGRLLDY
jgi:hypothetical protein